MGDLATDNGGRSAILEHHAWAGLYALSNHLEALTFPPDGKDGYDMDPEHFRRNSFTPLAAAASGADVLAGSIP